MYKIMVSSSYDATFCLSSGGGNGEKDKRKTSKKSTKDEEK